MGAYIRTYRYKKNVTYPKALAQRLATLKKSKLDSNKEKQYSFGQYIIS